MFKADQILVHIKSSFLQLLSQFFTKLSKEFSIRSTFIRAQIMLPKRLSLGYQKYYVDQYLTTMRWLMVLGTLFFLFFGGMDRFIITHVVPASHQEEALFEVLKLRFGFGLPVLTVMTFIAWTGYYYRFHQWITAAYILIIQLFLWMMMVSIEEPAAQHIYFSGLMLTHLSGLIISRMQFLPAVASTMVSSTFFLFGYHAVEAFAFTTMVIHLFFYFSASGLGLVACLSNEIHIRHHYFKLRDIKSEQNRLKQDNYSLHQLAQYDGLTGLANRRYFEEVYAKEWRRAERNRTPISIAMIDIDHFKQYNDHYGHQEGDQCLIQVATLISQFAKRVGDIAARYGGEEFVLLLPGLDEPAALSVSQRVCEAVEQLQIDHEHSPISYFVTVSIGVATVQPIPGIVDNAALRESLLRKSDQALYDAKHAGKNRALLVCDEGGLSRGSNSADRHPAEAMLFKSVQAGQKEPRKEHKALKSPKKGLSKTTKIVDRRSHTPVGLLDGFQVLRELESVEENERPPVRVDSQAPIIGATKVRREAVPANSLQADSVPVDNLAGEPAASATSDKSKKSHA